MEGAAKWLEHCIPDVVCTEDLPVLLAAEVDFLAGRFEPWLQQSRHIDAPTSARSLAFSSRPVEATEVLASVDVDALDANGIATAAWAASRSGGPSVPRLLEQLAILPGDFLGDEVPAGPRALFVGMLLAVQGNLVEAATELRAAVEFGDTRAPLWGAVARLELARVLRTSEAIPLAGALPTRPTLQAARTFFAAGGYRSLLDRAMALDQPVQAVFELDAVCRIGFGVEPPVAMRTSKGLTAIRHLLDHPDRVVTARELSIIIDGGDASEIAALSPGVWRGRDDEDPSAGDVEAKLREVFFDDSVRSRISKLLRRTIDKVGATHHLAGRHLSASITTGHGCRYQPTGHPVTWGLSGQVD